MAIAVQDRKDHVTHGMPHEPGAHAHSRITRHKPSFWYGSIPEDPGHLLHEGLEHILHILEAEARIDRAYLVALTQDQQF